MRITDLLIPILFLAGLGVMAWQLTSGKNKRDKALYEFATSRGWYYLPGKGGSQRDHQHPGDHNLLFSLKGVTPSGINWQLDSRGKIRLKGRETLMAHSRLVLQQPITETVIMVPDPGTDLPAGIMSRKLEYFGLNLEVGALEMKSWPREMHPRYSLYGHEGVDLSPLLETLSMTLAAWAARLPVPSQPMFLGGDETGLYLNWGIEKPEDVSALVTLAEKWSEGLGKIKAAA